MTARSLGVLAPLVLATVVAACGGSRHRPEDPGETVRGVLAEAESCPTGSMHIDDIGSGHYLAEGCGLRSVYRCERPGLDLGARLTPRCARVGGERAWRERAGAWGRTERPRPRLAQPATEGTEPAPTRVEPPPAADAEETPAVEVEARALVDRHRDAILECAGRDQMAVTASWTAEGEVTLSLRGDLEGGDEQACVRAATEGLRLDDAAEPGRVIHFIRRSAP